jgi:hypothetical protein
LRPTHSPPGISGGCRPTGPAHAASFILSIAWATGRPIGSPGAPPSRRSTACGSGHIERMISRACGPTGAR